MTDSKPTPEEIAIADQMMAAARVCYVWENEVRRHYADARDKVAQLLHSHAAEAVKKRDEEWASTLGYHESFANPSQLGPMMISRINDLHRVIAHNIAVAEKNQDEAVKAATEELHVSLELTDKTLALEREARERAEKERDGALYLAEEWRVLHVKAKHGLLSAQAEDAALRKRVEELEATIGREREMHKGELELACTEVAKSMEWHAFYQDSICRDPGFCDYTYEDGDYCGRPSSDHTAIEQARREGAEAMREQAALYVTFHSNSRRGTSELRLLADEIRELRLPLDPPKAQEAETPICPHGGIPPGDYPDCCTPDDQTRCAVKIGLSGFVAVPCRNPMPCQTHYPDPSRGPLDSNTNVLTQQALTEELARKVWSGGRELKDRIFSEPTREEKPKEATLPLGHSYDLPGGRTVWLGCRHNMIPGNGYIPCGKPEADHVAGAWTPAHPYQPSSDGSGCAHEAALINGFGAGARCIVSEADHPTVQPTHSVISEDWATPAPGDEPTNITKVEPAVPLPPSLSHLKLQTVASIDMDKRVVTFNDIERSTTPSLSADLKPGGFLTEEMLAESVRLARKQAADEMNADLPSMNRVITGISDADIGSADDPPVGPMNVANLPLHAWVATSLGCRAFLAFNTGEWCCGCPGHPHEYPEEGDVRQPMLQYDTDWSATGPLIDRYHIDLHYDHSSAVTATAWRPDHTPTAVTHALGETALEAICHLIIKLANANKLDLS